MPLITTWVCQRTHHHKNNWSAEALDEVIADRAAQGETPQ